MTLCICRLVKTNKAKLLHALEDGPDTSPCVEIPLRSVWIIDGMAMLQQMSPKNMPHTMGQLAKSLKAVGVFGMQQRINCDTFRDRSLPGSKH